MGRFQSSHLLRGRFMMAPGPDAPPGPRQYRLDWTTDVSDVYVVSGDVATKAASLVPICINATKAEVAKRRRRGGEGYVALVAVSSIGNDGTLMAKCLMNQIKKGQFRHGHPGK